MKFSGLRFRTVIGAVAVLLCLISVVFIAHGFYELQTNLKSTGRVVGFRDEPNARFPIVVFMSATGDSVRIEGSVSSDPPEFQVGQMVELSYPADDPASARIMSFWSLWFAPTFIAIFAFVAAIIWVVAVVMEGRSTAEQLFDIDAMPSTNDRTSRLRAAFPDDFNQRFRESEIRSNRIMMRVAWSFAAIGVILIACSAYSFYERQSFAASHKLYDAVIIDYWNGSRLTTPQYEFTDEKGQLIRAYSEVGMRGSIDSVGSRVTVYYDSIRHSAIDSSWFSFYMMSWICGLIGIVFCGFGALFVTLLRRDSAAR